MGANMHVLRDRVSNVGQRAERAALACESAAQEMEKASIELDKAAEVRTTPRKDTGSPVWDRRPPHW